MERPWRQHQVAILEREESLPPDSISPRSARQVVREVPDEAHVGGFSRHLSPGDAHVIGVPLELPVLRADGSEVSCNFLIERVPAGPNRTVYLAWIEPVGT